MDGPLETAPTAPGAAGHCRATLLRSPGADGALWAVVRLSMEHQEFLPRAVARFHGRRRRGLPKGARQTSAARGGVRERPAPSRPRRVGRRHDGVGPPTNNCVTLQWPARRVPSRLSAMSLASLMTLNFQRFENVSWMAT